MRSPCMRALPRLTAAPIYATQEPWSASGDWDKADHADEIGHLSSGRISVMESTEDGTADGED